MAISCTGVLLALLFAWSFAQDNTVVTLYDGADCASEASQAIWEPGAQDATSDGNCVMRLPATALSLMFSELLPGCTGEFTEKQFGRDLTVSSHSVLGCLL